VSKVQGVSRELHLIEVGAARNESKALRECCGNLLGLLRGPSWLKQVETAGKLERCYSWEEVDS